MKAVLIREQGGRENLKLEEIEKPIPASGEILVRVKACSLNYLDIFVRRGMPGLPVDLPRIGGGDIAGEIEEIGTGVKDLSPENTIESLNLAKKIGLNWIEFDVIISKDLIPILFHDDSLERTTNGKGLPIEYNYKDLKNLDAGSFFY